MSSVTLTVKITSLSAVTDAKTLIGAGDCLTATASADSAEATEIGAAD
jgi:hypothetical protein